MLRVNDKRVRWARHSALDVVLLLPRQVVAARNHCVDLDGLEKFLG